MFGIRAELENIPLANPHMLYKTPRRVRNVGALAPRNSAGNPATPCRSRGGHRLHRAGRGRVPLMQHLSSMPYQSAQDVRVMVQEARNIEYDSGQNSFSFRWNKRLLAELYMRHVDCSLNTIEIFRFPVNQSRSTTSIPLRTREVCSHGRTIINAERTGTMTSIRLSTKRDSRCLGSFAYEQANTLPMHPLRL